MIAPTHFDFSSKYPERPYRRRSFDEIKIADKKQDLWRQYIKIYHIDEKCEAAELNDLYEAIKDQDHLSIRLLASSPLYNLETKVNYKHHDDEMQI